MFDLLLKLSYYGLIDIYESLITFSIISFFYKKIFKNRFILYTRVLNADILGGAIGVNAIAIFRTNKICSLRIYLNYKNNNYLNEFYKDSLYRTTLDEYSYCGIIFRTDEDKIKFQLQNT